MQYFGIIIGTKVFGITKVHSYSNFKLDLMNIFIFGESKFLLNF